MSSEMLVSLWLTGERVMLSISPMEWHQLCSSMDGHGIVGIWTSDLGWRFFFFFFLGPESPKKRSAGVAQMELSKPHYFAFIRSAPSKRISELGAFLVFHIGRFYTICRLSIKWRSRNKMATDIMRARRHDATSNQISSNTAKIPTHSHTLSVFLPDRFCFEFASLRGQKHETGLGEFS